MDLFEFINMASGVDERNLPKSTANALPGRISRK